MTGLTDRDALLLHYFHRKPAREMAELLGTTEVAAQKRANRAVQRLRELLVKRGITASTAALVALISGNAVQSAPAGLALSITTCVGLAATSSASLSTLTTAQTLTMTSLQKTLITAVLATAIGVGVYEARQASFLRAKLKAVEAKPHLQEPTTGVAVSSLRSQVEQLKSEKMRMAVALDQASAENAHLLAEREQARRSAALYKEVVEQAISQDVNPTNAYPTRRHVWAAFGRVGRVAAQSREDQGNISVDEASALKAAQMKAMDELPQLLKAMKEFDALEPAGAELEREDVIDNVACLLYGALSLDEQQFGRIYGVMKRIEQEAQEKGYSKNSRAAQLEEATKLVMEQFKAETQTLLTPEQARIFSDVVAHIQLEPGKFGFNFSF